MIQQTSRYLCRSWCRCCLSWSLWCSLKSSLRTPSPSQWRCTPGILHQRGAIRIYLCSTGITVKTVMYIYSCSTSIIVKTLMYIYSCSTNILVKTLIYINSCSTGIVNQCSGIYYKCFWIKKNAKNLSFKDFSFQPGWKFSPRKTPCQNFEIRLWCWESLYGPRDLYITVSWARVPGIRSCIKNILSNKLMRMLLMKSLMKLFAALSHVGNVSAILWQSP
jgi:hypothetical protein